ncbi:polysaccharide biosynthesis C-terminal domain-containing protein [uncultured Nonlabens sp.]|uniref:oligosaccharide flippase family protein n=1 Tax=uncultured Nonlabens sp. TaxID=859306 RepID=UPI0030D9B590|tara:strand:- start:31785 stop:33242 length:1458 start_codon:yes stop_codon:yes gene_type:complete
MGVVIKQSVWNLVITGLGFVLGALNVLILAQIYLSDDYYGLWNYVLSTSFLFFPLMSFGIHNTIVKYYSSYTTKEGRDGFLTQMLLWPLCIIIPVIGIIYLAQDTIASYISDKNEITGAFLWCIPLIAIFQAYFEIFYAWVKVHMKTIGGNFLKEVFYRAGAMLTLMMLAMGWIDQTEFIYSLVFIYALRALLMNILAFQTYLPVFKFQKLMNTSKIINYSIYMIIAGSISTALIDLDKFMLNQYVTIDQIGYYGIAVFIATVIAVPARGMAQITHPLTAGHFNRNEMGDVAQLYKRSSLNLSVVAGFLLVIIFCNLNEFYAMMPQETRIAIPVVFLISLTKFSENLLGSNNAILYNSDLYKVTLWMGFLLTFVAIGLNWWLIPEFGIIGAAIATCMAYLCYAFAKAYYVYIKLKIHPWTSKTWNTLFLIVAIIGAFYFWDFTWHPLVNIAIKSVLISLIYLGSIYKMKLSSEMNQIINRYFLRS